MWPEPSLAPILWLIAATLVLAGLVGVVLPVMPGAVLVYLGLLLGAWIDGFERVGPFTILLLTAATALVYVIDFAAGSFGAKHLGASKRAVWGAALGTLVGLFFGIPGILVGRGRRVHRPPPAGPGRQGRRRDLAGPGPGRRRQGGAGLRHAGAVHHLVHAVGRRSGTGASSIVSCPVPTSAAAGAGRPAPL